jgi:hypothetical protein
MGITYQNHILTTMRPDKNPQLIENAIDCFLYTDSLFNLGSFRIDDSGVELDMNKIENLRDKVSISLSKDDHNYQHVSFSIPENHASFNFLHTPHIQNCEKVNYKVTSCEEFFVFLEYFYHYMTEYKIRYSEIFISAYDHQFQKLINAFGFSARGYIPCWKYQEKEDYFEDYILFNFYQGELSNLDLLPEGLQLCDLINLNKSEDKTASI